MAAAAPASSPANLFAAPNFSELLARIIGSERAGRESPNERASEKARASEPASAITTSAPLPLLCVRASRLAGQRRVLVCAQCAQPLASLPPLYRNCCVGRPQFSRTQAKHRIGTSLGAASASLVLLPLLARSLARLLVPRALCSPPAACTRASYVRSA